MYNISDFYEKPPGGFSPGGSIPMSQYREDFLISASRRHQLTIAITE